LCAGAEPCYGRSVARPTKITDEVSEAIDYLYRPGMSGRALVAQLGEAGIAVDRRTVDRYLARRRAAGATLAPPPAPAGAPVPADELTGLEAQLAALDAALGSWAPSLGADPRAVRSWTALVNAKKGVLAAIDELKPRASAEAERLATLGNAAKAELLERVRATARADEGLRGIVARQQEEIERLWGMVDA
jgi:hypothetical protein